MSAGSRLKSRSPAAFLGYAQNVHTDFLGKLQHLFYHVGRVIGHNVILFLLVTLAVSLLSYGSIYLRFAQRLQDGFVSTHSLARVENAIKTEFDGVESSAVQRFVVLVRRRDAGNILERTSMDDIENLYKYLKHNFTVHINGGSFTHSELCGGYCEANHLLWGFKKCIEGVYNQEDVFVDHPQSRIQHYSFLVAPHVFGISRKDPPTTPPPTANLGKRVFIPYNSNHTWPSESNRTALRSAAMISLYFQAPIPDENVSQILTEWESSVYKWTQAINQFDQLKIDVMGDRVLAQEMTQAGLSLLPHFAAGVISTVIFVAAMVFYNASRVKRIDFGLVVIVIGIVISPMLAVSTTFGIMGFSGIEIYPVHLVIPFLILAIGVDDAFLMSHAWDRLVPHVAYEAPNSKAITAELFGKVLEEVGPSITITSLTNALAFGVGTIFSTPAMQMFCLSAAIAITLDFIFEITLFGSLLVLAGRCYKTSSRLVDKKPMTDKIVSKYSHFLTRNDTRIGVLGFTLVFFGLSLFGTLIIETQVDSQKIIPNNSSLLISDALFKEYYWTEYEPLQIFVNNPPNISDPETWRRFKRMVADFESMPRAIGAKSTMLWLNDYEQMQKDIDFFMNLILVDYPLSYDQVPDFLVKTKFGAIWNSTIKWHMNGNQVVVDQFAFFTGLHNGTTWVERAKNMLIWREVAAKWNEFNVTVYSENSAVFEGIFNMPVQTTLTAVLTLISMVAVCIFFVPSFVGVVCAALAIASISLGVLGFLSLTGLDLDPITMSAIVMSIGFSVDYTAHVSYHYQRSFMVLPRGCTAADSLEYTISSVGWPMVEAALSTLVCFVPVAFHPDYTPTVFVRTIFFVVLFGVLHGLVILPTVLAVIPRRCFVLDPSRHGHHYLANQPLPEIIEPKSQATTPLPSDSSSSNLTESSNETTTSLLTGEL